LVVHLFILFYSILFYFSFFFFEFEFEFGFNLLKF